MARNPQSRGAVNPTAYSAGQHSVVYPNAPPGLLFPGDPGVPKWGTNPVYKNAEPRENVTQFFHVFPNHAARVVVIMKAFQSPVANRADHL